MSMNIMDARTGELSRIAAIRRQAISEWTPDPEKVDTENEDGDKIREITVTGPRGTSRTVEVNLTKLFQPGLSTTGDVEMLVREAELVADGVELGNPHIPFNETILERATARIEAEGLTPAWEVSQ